MRFLYLIFYWKLEAFFGGMLDDGLQDWKAGAVLIGLTIFFVIGVSLLFAIYTGTPWLFASRGLAISVGLAAVGGHWVLVGSPKARRAAWRKYRGWSERRRAFATVAVLIVTIAVVTFAFWALGFGERHGVINPKT